jgi:PTH2 family peptidyl-tRNA hydrolase
MSGAGVTYKCVCLVRKDLQMSKGKIAAQCGHGIVYAVRNSTMDKLDLWCNSGEKIVALSVPNEKTMQFMYNKAQKNKLVSHIVCDAGHTEVTPNTNTVCVIGPDTETRLNKIVKDLKLL